MDMPPKRSLSVLLAMLVAMTPFGLSTYLPAFPEIASNLNADITTVQFSLTLFLLGFAFGQLCGGPVSDTFGRRPVALSGISVFIVSSLLISMAQTVDQLLLLRFLQALGGGFSTVNASAMVRDLFNKQDSARMLSMISIMVLTAPLAAPAIGAFMLKLLGWRSIFWLLAGYGTLLLVTLYFKMPETRKRQPGGLNLKKITQDYLQVIRHRRAISFIFSQSFSSGMQFSFVTASPFIYMEYFGVSPDVYPVLFAGNVLAMMSFNRMNYWLLNRWTPERILKRGITMQLLANGLLITCTFFDPTLFMVVALVMFAVGCQSMIWPNASACALSFFPNASGSATAITGCLRFMMGAMTGSLVSFLHNGTLLPVAFMMVLCTGLSMISYKVAIRETEREAALT